MDTDDIGSCESNYHTIMTMMAQKVYKAPIRDSNYWYLVFHKRKTIFCCLKIATQNMTEIMLRRTIVCYSINALLSVC